jgi:hypothetical protein
MLFWPINLGVNGTRSRARENVELFQLMARKIHGALVATHFGEYGAWTTAFDEIGLESDCDTLKSLVAAPNSVLALALPRLRGGVGSIDLIRYRRACWKDKLAPHQSGTRTGTCCALERRLAFGDHNCA